MSNKDEAIKAAAELFHRQGFRNTSVDQVLEACGISKSNFYYHFKCKEDLGFAVLEKWIEGYGIHMLNEVLRDENLAPPARLERFFSKLAALIERSGGRLGCPFGNLSLELSDVHEGFRTRLAEFFEEWAQALEACLEQGKREGVWSKELDSREMAFFIIAAAEGSILLTKTFRSPPLFHDGMEVIWRMLDGYKPFFPENENRMAKENR